jgi:hypothetical protein
MYSSSQGPPDGVGLGVQKLKLYLTPKRQRGNLHPFVKFYTIVMYARHDFIYLFFITCITKKNTLCKTFGIKYEFLLVFKVEFTNNI